METLAQPWLGIVIGIETFLFIYFVIINGYYLFTGLVALFRLPWFVKLHLADPVRRSTSTLDTPITMLVPAYNESSIIVPSIESMLALAYVNFEVIIINDGSTDDTMQLLADTFKLEPYEGVYRGEIPTADVVEVYQSTIYPDLRVIDKKNGGKGDALNAGINLARFPLIFSSDADSFYRPETLQWMAEPFLKDRQTVAVGGAIAVGHPTVGKHDSTFMPALPRSIFKQFQVMEYLRAFLGTRMGYAPFNALGIVSGACGLWKRDVLMACGGFRTDTIWEDMEMTMRVHNFCIQTGRKYRIAFTPFPVCWTDVPENTKVLWNQRKGWHRHLSECMSIHRNLLFGKGGFFSWVTMPYFVFFEWLAPVVVLFGLTFSVICMITGIMDWQSQIWLLVLVFLLAILGSTISILLDEISYTSYDLKDIGPLLVASILENFGYRQFVMIANFAGFLAWLFKRPYRGTKKYPGPFVKAWSPTVKDEKNAAVTANTGPAPAA